MSDSQLELQRERAIQTLIAQFARDALSVEDLDARLEHAQSARSSLELQALVSDLPALPADHIATPLPTPVYALAAPREGDGTQEIRAVFGEVVRRGQWVVPERIDVSVLMGSTVLDLTQAKLQPGLMTIDATVIFGDLNVIVPPGVRLECHAGTAIFGSFDHKETPRDTLPADAPTVRVTGTAILGSVTVKVRYPKLKGSARNWLKGLLGT